MDWPFGLDFTGRFFCSSQAHSHICSQLPGWLGASWSRAFSVVTSFPALCGLSSRMLVQVHVVAEGRWEPKDGSWKCLEASAWKLYSVTFTRLLVRAVAMQPKLKGWEKKLASPWEEAEVLWPDCQPPAPVHVYSFWIHRYQILSTETSLAVCVCVCVCY